MDITENQIQGQVMGEPRSSFQTKFARQTLHFSSNVDKSYIKYCNSNNLKV
jgi:hypothetical protein